MSRNCGSSYSSTLGKTNINGTCNTNNNRFAQGYLSNCCNNRDYYKLPVINNGTTMPNNNPLFCRTSNQASNLLASSPPFAADVNPIHFTDICNVNCGNAHKIKPCPSSDIFPDTKNACSSSYNNCKMSCLPPNGYKDMNRSSDNNYGLQTPANKGWSSTSFTGFGKSGLHQQNMSSPFALDRPGGNYPNSGYNNNCNTQQRPVTSNGLYHNSLSNNSNGYLMGSGQKTVLRDRRLADEILQKAGIPFSNPCAVDCVEVISDCPVSGNDNISCDPHPLCMRKPADSQPPPPPRQVIVERLPTPPAKPRQIIFEKWLPYEEPKDRPCIVEKAEACNYQSPPKNVIIQYESLEPRIQANCVDEGVLSMDPQQYVKERPSGNAEVCYVDKISNLPDNIRCQLGPQALACVNSDRNKNMNIDQHSFNTCVVRTNPQQQQRDSRRQPRSSLNCRPAMSTPSTGRQQQLSSHCSQPCPQPCTMSNYRNTNNYSSASSMPKCITKYDINQLARPGQQAMTNVSRSYYNPWITTYGASYTNKNRVGCRTH
ncbi:unnamed protein product [Didymodactylos carnosus]|uniref:Uncharacterized protein n=1 Tax=Didymodactylos carnosus TaxID=1234261 RepID=A0A813SJS3_9BILA|nr:unnamed protein product [Didymodactylos carnosus]CAF0797311.1 unnamed protein product [Didymodactylos carnosus]CAF3556264.1 unnamed protein product [Didymodactylos carnosus]CAF3582066.1 unnamed protein product [Didymodactylos carnosus]